MTPPVSRLPRVLDIEETAEHLKTSRKTVIRLIKRGELPATLIGRQFRIAEDDILALIRRPWK